ncbi:MAG: hypothetical protein AUJ23_01370 [Candidatus Magasanikbacteria bacterium CG1_02_32_51]|uniref:Uncharacterized protein n=1 Tax=Candidatus Magasanikbacteria bacterium CG1_02_32_51 TaxID=1805238 RepID=A0A1J4UAZ6_9BACT|nr:MAG: hypothetical protein AUJ23_01370 [Candidatus Magasanikbacteria bacterium CG1_02_32_51]
MSEPTRGRGEEFSPELAKERFVELHDNFSKKFKELSTKSEQVTRLSSRVLDLLKNVSDDFVEKLKNKVDLANTLQDITYELNNIVDYLKTEGENINVADVEQKLDFFGTNLELAFKNIEKENIEHFDGDKLDFFGGKYSGKCLKGSDGELIPDGIGKLEFGDNVVINVFCDNGRFVTGNIENASIDKFDSNFAGFVYKGGVNITKDGWMPTGGSLKKDNETLFVEFKDGKLFDIKNVYNQKLENGNIYSGGYKKVGDKFVFDGPSGRMIVGDTKFSGEWEEGKFVGGKVENYKLLGVSYTGGCFIDKDTGELVIHGEGVLQQVDGAKINRTWENVLLSDYIAKSSSSDEEEEVDLDEDQEEQETVEERVVETPKKKGFFQRLFNKEDRQEIKENIKVAGKNMIKPLLNMAYKTATSVFGVKLVTDSLGLLVGKGDYAKMWKNKKEREEIRESFREAFQEILSENSETAPVVEEAPESAVPREILEKFAKVNAKIDASQASAEDKAKLKTQLHEILEQDGTARKENYTSVKEKVAKIIETYTDNKLSLVTVLKDALNTVGVATGLFALRGIAYAGTSVVERLRTHKIENKKKDLEGKESEKESAMKDLLQNSIAETWRGLTFQGIKKDGNTLFETFRGNRKDGNTSKQRVFDFIKSVGTVLRGLGIYGVAVGDGIPEAFARLKDNLEVHDLASTVGHNFVDNFERVFSIFGSKDESKTELVEQREKAKTLAKGMGLGAKASPVEQLGGDHTKVNPLKNAVEVIKPEPQIFSLTVTKGGSAWGTLDKTLTSDSAPQEFKNMFAGDKQAFAQWREKQLLDNGYKKVDGHWGHPITVHAGAEMKISKGDDGQWHAKYDESVKGKTESGRVYDTIHKNNTLHFQQTQQGEIPESNHPINTDETANIDTKHNISDQVQDSKGGTYVSEGVTGGTKPNPYESMDSSQAIDSTTQNNVETVVATDTKSSVPEATEVVNDTKGSIPETQSDNNVVQDKVGITKIKEEVVVPQKGATKVVEPVTEPVETTKPSVEVGINEGHTQVAINRDAKGNYQIEVTGDKLSTPKGELIKKYFHPEEQGHARGKGILGDKELMELRKLKVYDDAYSKMVDSGQSNIGEAKALKLEIRKILDTQAKRLGEEGVPQDFFATDMLKRYDYRVDTILETPHVDNATTTIHVADKEIMIPMNLFPEEIMEKYAQMVTKLALQFDNLPASPARDNIIEEFSKALKAGPSELEKFAKHYGVSKSSK